MNWTPSIFKRYFFLHNKLQEPPKEVVAIDEQIWHSFTEGQLEVSS